LKETRITSIPLTDKKLQEAKRDSVLFLVFFSLFVIAISSITFTKRYESSTDDDDGTLYYSHRIFLFFCTNFVYLLYVTIYLAISMYFVALHLKESLEALRIFRDMLKTKDSDSPRSIRSSVTISNQLESLERAHTGQETNLCSDKSGLSCPGVILQYAMDFFVYIFAAGKIFGEKSGETLWKCLKKFWECFNNKDFKALKGASIETVSIQDYIDTVESVAKRVDKLEFVMNLLIFSALLNTLSFFFLVWFLIREKKSAAGLKALVYLPFLIKEVYFFFYVLWKGLRVNTLHDNISLFLAEKGLDFTSDINISQIKKNQLYAIQFHTTVRPVGLKFFGFRISYYNFWVLFGTTILAALGFLVKMHDIIEKGHI
jgi:hypothetical protein